MKNEKTKEELIKRQEEIYSQLEKTNEDLGIELDRNMEDQAIQIEQEEVAITMESNLRKELAEIEEKLAEFDE
jgi:RNA polymerase-binding transcription factor DksA